jgi:Asp-tRNA(Asn)/Glu-tRNA(Gln) amidotransferase A subunit family amidase
MPGHIVTGTVAPPFDATLTTPPLPGTEPPGLPPDPEDRAHLDLTERVQALVGQAGVEGSPWVWLRPEAIEEAAPGGRPNGPLADVVVAVKDLVAVAGLPLGAGTAARAGAPPEPADAPVVTALRQSGAVVAGTVALHELAFGVTGVNDSVGFPANPEDPERIPGGSSSGSAVAVATGECDMAVGTDTGGSVRIPAALCGVVGFKPGRNRYPLDGVLPLAPTLDRVGLLARTVADIAVAHRMITGDRVATRMPLRLGVDMAALNGAEPAVQAVLEPALLALTSQGVKLHEIRWPVSAEVLEVSTTILFAEAASVHHRLLDGGAPLGVDVAARLATGAAIDPADHEQALIRRRELAELVRETLSTVDAVVGPTVPVTAPTLDFARAVDTLPGQLVANTRLANVCEIPALSLPIVTDGLPVGLQVMAGSDATTLGVAAALSPLIGPGG